MSQYKMSHMHLGCLLLTRLEQHGARRTDGHQLTSFTLETPSPVVPWVVYYIKNSIFLINASLHASRVEANTVRLHVTHSVLASGVET